MDLKKQLDKIRLDAEKAFKKVDNQDRLEELRVEFLGKKGKITDLLHQMNKISIEERPIIGKKTNQLKVKINDIMKAKKAELEELANKSRFAQERIDITLPGIKPVIGHRHPLTKVIDEIKEIFIGLGFNIAEGPEIETEYNNFEALNVPKYHPARDLQDTFYLDEKYLLRTQTSPVQIRTLAKQKPPIRIIAPGRVYRSDELDASHSPIFHQIEGLVIDKNISFSDLKGTIELVLKAIYGKDIKMRFRPSYFPFTEPSAEIDISCVVCKGKGCKLCSHSGWLEIIGSGMVHPNVLEMAGLDPMVYSGFAFGMGWDRIAMLKYGVNDIRLLFENDQRFLEQF